MLKKQDIAQEDSLKEVNALTLFFWVLTRTVLFCLHSRSSSLNDNNKTNYSHIDGKLLVLFPDSSNADITSFKRFEKEKKKEEKTGALQCYRTVHFEPRTSLCSELTEQRVRYICPLADNRLEKNRVFLLCRPYSQFRLRPNRLSKTADPVTLQEEAITRRQSCRLGR